MKHVKQEEKGLSKEEIQQVIHQAEKFFISQKLAIMNRETKKFLLLLNANNNTWELPGGLVDAEDADLHTALQRELLEEVGNGVKYGEATIASIIKTQYKWEGGPYPVSLVTYVALYEGGDVTLSQEHLEYSWMTFQEIQELSEEKMKPVMRKIIGEVVTRSKEREYLADLQRLQADFENYKRRQAEAQKELKGFLIEKLVLELIPVLDNFRSANAHVPEASKNDPWAVGVQYIEKQLEDVLVSNGMQAIEVKEGDAFDPRLHEAVSRVAEVRSAEQGVSEENAEESPENQLQTVAKVLQKGYKLGEKVVRPAKVVVS